MCLFLRRNQSSQKIPKKSPKLFLLRKLPEPEGQLEGATGPSGGHQPRPPLAAPGGPLGTLAHLPGSPSVFRSLRPRNGEARRIFPGQVEQMNGLILQGLKPRLEEPSHHAAGAWVEELPAVLWSIRTTPNRSTGYTPFFLVYGA